jgi:hypothetical protein
MKIGDKVRIIDNECFGWAKGIALSEIQGTVLKVLDGESLFLVGLTKNGVSFNPLFFADKTEWHFWPSEIEAI